MADETASIKVTKKAIVLPKSGIAVGLNKGHILTLRPKKERPSQKKGHLGEKAKIVRGIIREVAGWAPYERRIMEILKGGGSNPTKRAWRFAKNRLGTHVRAKKKVAEMVLVNAQIAQKQAQQKEKVKEKKGKDIKKDTKTKEVKKEKKPTKATERKEKEKEAKEKDDKKKATPASTGGAKEDKKEDKGKGKGAAPAKPAKDDKAEKPAKEDKAEKPAKPAKDDKAAAKPVKDDKKEKAPKKETGGDKGDKGKKKT